MEIADGAKVILRAPEPSIIAAGRAEASKSLLDDADVPFHTAAHAFSKGILLAAVKDFTGIGDADGEPLECTPENVELLLRDIFVFDRLDAEYVVPIAKREEEKNVSAASSDGTTEKETAAQTIADSPADTNEPLTEANPSMEDS